MNVDIAGYPIQHVCTLSLEKTKKGQDLLNRVHLN